MLLTASPLAHVDVPPTPDIVALGTALQPPAQALEAAGQAELIPGPGWQLASPPQMAALGAAVIALLLLLLYVYRRRGFVLEWTFSWMLLSASLLIVATDYGSRTVGLAMLGLSYFLGVAAALLLVMGADTYRRQTSPGSHYLWIPVPLLIWFILAPVVLGSRAVVVPGYLISAVVLATAGASCLASLRGARFLGAALVGVTLLLLAVSYGWIAIWISRSGAPGGLPVWVLWLNALFYLFAAFGMHLLVFEDMTYDLRVINRRLAAAQADLRQLVITDPLTGCYNRRFFDEIIRRELNRHRRYETPLSLMFIDVDRFKAVNDSLGHEAGDRVLRYVANFLRRHIREADYLFRWGGDEFLILISCRLDEAIRKAAELKATFRDAPEAETLPPGVGLSIGCAAVPPDATDITPQIQEADARMYEDKELGARG